MSAGMPITDDDLHAFADGALADERAAEVEQHLTATPADAARVAFYRRLNNDLHAQFDPVLGESIPPRLLATPYVRRRAWALPTSAARSRSRRFRGGRSRRSRSGAPGAGSPGTSCRCSPARSGGR